jgi:flagellar hook-basal body complex protein FliE
MNPITSLPPTTFLPSAPPALSAAAPQQPFKDMLLDALQQVNQMQHDADQAVQQLSAGADVNPAAVLTSLQKTDMSLKLMLQVQSELVQAVQEVNNIRI